MRLENTLMLAHSKLVEFEQAPLLKNCGLTTNVPDVVFVESWDAAVYEAQSVEWESLGLSGRNKFINKLRVNAKDRTYTWNEAVDNLKPAVNDFVARLLVGQPLLKLMPGASIDILNGTCYCFVFTPQTLMSPGFGSMKKCQNGI